MDKQQPSQRLKSQDFVNCLNKFFGRELISIPLAAKHVHGSFMQRYGLKAATLEFDTTSFPNIEYVAGTRLNVYPINPADQVDTVIDRVVDDIQTIERKSKSASPHDQHHQPVKKASVSDKSSPFWPKFQHLNGHNSLRLALMFLYDINNAPSRNLLKILSRHCSRDDEKSSLLSICRTNETYDRWMTSKQHTLKSVLDEYPSCSNIPFRLLVAELQAQQPRQYSISSIKSSKRFRAEIIVVQHRFTSSQMSHNLENMRERAKLLDPRDAPSKTAVTVRSPSSPGIVHIDPNGRRVPDEKGRDDVAGSSVKSIRSTTNFGHSPISSQQISLVPSFSGPLMSIYATSTKSATSRKSLSSISSHTANSLVLTKPQAARSPADRASKTNQFDGLCSSYLLNLTSTEQILCEFVENPRFTLKGNRERPIMMIGQDIGIIAFRAFWQQRSLEHDRAQVFYTMFKDLSPKNFGEMQLVLLAGSENSPKVDDLFKREMMTAQRARVLTSVTRISRNQLSTVLEQASGATDGAAQNNQLQPMDIRIDSKDLTDLGYNIYKLLCIDNGCLYSCCDLQMTQAIEILMVESITRNSSLTKEQVMSLLPIWKGSQRMSRSTNANYLFKLENSFERAQIVQEIYDSSI